MKIDKAISLDVRDVISCFISSYSFCSTLDSSSTMTSFDTSFRLAFFFLTLLGGETFMGDINSSGFSKACVFFYI